MANTTIQRRDLVVALLLWAVMVALCSLFRSAYAYHWDGAQFAIAIGEYDIAKSQPHAPGYFLYVMLGRLLNLVIGDPHGTFVWMSAFFAGGLVAMVYLLATAMFGRWVGVTAGLLTMTSPQVWFHGCVALTYTTDAFLVCLAVFWCWRLMQGGGRWPDVLWFGVLLGVTAGVRQQRLPMLAPLILYTFWHFNRQQLVKLIALGAVTGLVGLCWFLPMLSMTGGWKMYWHIFGLHAEYHGAADTLIGGGLEPFLDNVFWAGAFCWNGLMLGVPVLIAALCYRVVLMPKPARARWQNQHGRAMTVLTLWIVTGIVYATALAFTLMPGHVMGYLPGLLILVAVAVGRLRHRLLRFTVAAVLVAVNASAFLAWPVAWDEVLFAHGRSAREIRDHDHQLAQTIDTLREEFDPAEVAVGHAGEWFLFGLRHFQLHAPEFDHYQMVIDPTVPTPPGRPIWYAHEGHLEFVPSIDPVGKRLMILVVPPYLDTSIFTGRFAVVNAKPVSRSGGILYALPLTGQK